MAMQGIWTGTVSFSLVAIPVELVRAVTPGRVSFRMLHALDYSPLSRRMYCPEHDKMVPPDETVRGYEVGPGKYVLVTDEELESVTPERSRTIEITEFIDLNEVDPLYYDQPYYLVPLKGGEKSYRLLAEVLSRTNKAGLAKFVLGSREYLVAVKSTAGALTVITLRYGEEILPDKDISPKEAKADSTEKSRMKKVVKGMMADYDARKYSDLRRKKIMALLKKKAKEHPAVSAPVIEEQEGEGPADLVAALEESMRAVRGGR